MSLVLRVLLFLMLNIMGAISFDFFPSARRNPSARRISETTASPVNLESKSAFNPEVSRLKPGVQKLRVQIEETKGLIKDSYNDEELSLKTTQNRDQQLEILILSYQNKNQSGKSPSITESSILSTISPSNPELSIFKPGVKKSRVQIEQSKGLTKDSYNDEELSLKTTQNRDQQLKNLILSYQNKKRSGKLLLKTKSSILSIISPSNPEVSRFKPGVKKTRVQIEKSKVKNKHSSNDEELSLKTTQNRDQDLENLVRSYSNRGRSGKSPKDNVLTTSRRTTASTTVYIDNKETNTEPLEIFYELLTSKRPNILTQVEVVTTSSRPAVVESETRICPDRDSTFIIPHPVVCDIFYLCQKGVVSTRDCPENFIFSLSQAQCVPGQVGDCDGRPKRRNLLLTTSTTVLVFTTTTLAPPQNRDQELVNFAKSYRNGAGSGKSLLTTKLNSNLSTGLYDLASSTKSTRTTTPTPSPDINCPDSVYNYIIPHSVECDSFFICKKGKVSTRLCPDGLIFSISQLKCVLPKHGQGDCDERPLLQPATGTGSCVRQNGVFPTDSCTDYVTCRDNVPRFDSCPEGLIYDSGKKICDWIDTVLRPGCLTPDFQDFRYPNPILDEETALEEGVRLPFGDHDRHPDPKDCRFYFICFITGQPRRTGCGNGQVFSHHQSMQAGFRGSWL